MCPQVGVYTQVDADADIAAHAALKSAHHVAPAKLKLSGTRWVIPGWMYSAVVSIGLTSGHVYYTPIRVDETTTFIRIGIINVNINAGKYARVGIYNWNNGLPGSLVLDAGKIELSAADELELTISQELTPGYYFAAIVQDVNDVLYGVDITKAVVTPVDGFYNDPWEMKGVGMRVEGQVAQVAGGLADPATAPTHVLDGKYNYVRLRES